MPLLAWYNSGMNTPYNAGDTSDDTDEMKITIRLPRTVAVGMRVSAKANDRSLNGEIVRALREYLARQRSQQKQKDA